MNTPELVTAPYPIIDPRLDRLVEFDPRSRDFPIRAMLSAEEIRAPRTHVWNCKTYLNQGREGACVGFSWAHELIARPQNVRRVTNDTGKLIYYKARTLDQWPGENYSGTSVIAGAKATMELFPNHIKGFKWAFTVDDAIATLSWIGPAILGCVWKEGMFRPDANGFIHATGATYGGHAILIIGVNIQQKFFWLHNSWGKLWGMDGRCKLSFDDLFLLMREWGEICIPIRNLRAAA